MMKSKMKPNSTTTSLLLFFLLAGLLAPPAVAAADTAGMPTSHSNIENCGHTPGEEPPPLVIDPASAVDPTTLHGKIMAGEIHAGSLPLSIACQHICLEHKARLVSGRFPWCWDLSFVTRQLLRHSSSSCLPSSVCVFCPIGVASTQDIRAGSTRPAPVIATPSGSTGPTVADPHPTPPPISSKCGPI